MARNRKRAKERQRSRRSTTDPGSGRGVATARGGRGPAPERGPAAERGPAPELGPAADLDPAADLGSADELGSARDGVPSSAAEPALGSETSADDGSESLEPEISAYDGSKSLEPETPGALEHATPDVELAEAQLALGRAEAAGEITPQFSESDADDIEFGEAFDADGDLDGEGPADNGGGYGGRGEGGRPPRGGALAHSGDAVPAPRSLPGGRLVNFLQGSWRELQRVQWPDRRQVMQATGVVIGFVIVAGVFLGLADFVATHVVNFILK